MIVFHVMQNALHAKIQWFNAQLAVLQEILEYLYQHQKHVFVWINIMKIQHLSQIQIAF
jgi:hypothetical protein